jgi:thiamine-monophosphate kinase
VAPALRAVSGEDRLLRWLRGRLRHPLIGDDAAVLPASGPLAVTVDSQIAGVHFVAGLDPALVARRLLAVNLSDLAAMGALPAHAFLALTAPPDFDHRRFFRALLAACERHRVRLAGGDLARGADDRTCIATLTLLGRKRRGGRWLRRGGAAPGHRLWLGGTAGESAAGRLLVAAGARLAGQRMSLPPGWLAAAGGRALGAAARRAVRRHLLPQPQLALGQWLGGQREGAAIDVSDGVARDLHRLCDASDVGVRVEAGELPLAARFTALAAALGADASELAWGGGEDYVLLFTLPPNVAPPARFSCRAIGTITRRRRRVIVAPPAAGAAPRALPRSGWDHFDDRR